MIWKNTRKVLESVKKKNLKEEYDQCREGLKEEYDQCREGYEQGVCYGQGICTFLSVLFLPERVLKSKSTERKVQLEKNKCQRAVISELSSSMIVYDLGQISKEENKA